MARTKRKVPAINGSSTADIAFILLIFFLITTSMDTDKGLKRRLPPLSPKEEQQNDIEINNRNVLQLLVNRNDQIAVLHTSNAGQSINMVPLHELKDRVKEFIVNPANKADLPEKEVRDIPGLGRIETTTSSYAISLKNEVETSYQMYINVQNELLKAYNEVWDDAALKHFSRNYDDLPAAQQKMIVDIYPMHISEMPLTDLKH